MLCGRKTEQRPNGEVGYKKGGARKWVVKIRGVVMLAVYRL